MASRLIIAGPCALLPDAERMIKLATDLKEVGADVFRAGAWKGGTAPPPLGSSVWGMGEAAVPLMERIMDEVKMPVTTEVATMDRLAHVTRFDYIWTPARMMQAYPIMRQIAAACADSGQTLMVKRGTGNTLREINGIIKHVEQVGYPLDRLWIIERGIAGIGYEEECRWRPDLLIIPQIKDAYPQVRVCVDCSHSVGRREHVDEIAFAAVAAGAEGVMLEVLDRPDDSPSDARQTIDVQTFAWIAQTIRNSKN